MKYHTVQDEVSDRLMVEEIKYKVKQKDMVGFIDRLMVKEIKYLVKQKDMVGFNKKS